MVDAVSMFADRFFWMYAALGHRERRALVLDARDAARPNPVSGRFLANRRHDFTYGANDCVGSFHRNTMPTVGHEHLTSATISQAAMLARCPHRPVILLEGPRPARMPEVHPHALKGAMASLAVMWRLPVLVARDPADSVTILRFLACQLRSSNGGLKRYDRKPKRFGSRKLYMLQGLPGVGPALAHRLLIEFGSVERVVTADEDELTRVRGVGRQKAARIRDLVG
jgi:DNA excision repair protein ERCC-4